MQVMTLSACCVRDVPRRPVAVETVQRVFSQSSHLLLLLLLLSMAHTPERPSEESALRQRDDLVWI